MHLESDIKASFKNLFICTLHPSYRVLIDHEMCFHLKGIQFILQHSRLHFCPN